MKYICNDVIQEHDVTIHYTRGSSGLEINAVCPQCLEKYLKIRKGDNYKKSDENERMRMKRKWI